MPNAKRASRRIATLTIGDPASSASISLVRSNLGKIVSFAGEKPYESLLVGRWWECRRFVLPKVWDVQLRQLLIHSLESGNVLAVPRSDGGDSRAYSLS